MTDVYVLSAVGAVLIIVGGVACLRGAANTRIIGLSCLIGGVALIAFCLLAILPVG